MQSDDFNETIPPAAEAVDLLSNIADMFFTALGPSLFDFCKAQQKAMLDPLSALTE